MGDLHLMLDASNAEGGDEIGNSLRHKTVRSLLKFLDINCIEIND